MDNQIRLYQSYTAYAGQRSIRTNGGVSDRQHAAGQEHPIIAAGGKNHLPIVRVHETKKGAAQLTSADGRLRCACVVAVVAHHRWCSSSVHTSSSCESVQDTVTSNLSCTIRYNSQKGIKGRRGGRAADLPDS